MTMFGASLRDSTVNETELESAENESRQSRKSRRMLSTSSRQSRPVITASVECMSRVIGGSLTGMRHAGPSTFQAGSLGSLLIASSNASSALLGSGGSMNSTGPRAPSLLNGQYHAIDHLYFLGRYLDQSLSVLKTPLFSYGR
jgi:hypothetical protein